MGHGGSWIHKISIIRIIIIIIIVLMIGHLPKVGESETE